MKNLKTIGTKFIVNRGQFAGFTGTCTKDDGDMLALKLSDGTPAQWFPVEDVERTA